MLLLAIGCGGVACGGDRSASTVAPPGRPAAAREPAAFEIDHLWIAAAPGAPERTAFERAGFRIAPAVNAHEGQGTSSVTVELDNGFLELIYPDPAVSVAPNLQTVHAQFQKRVDWRASGYSPFGIGIRKLAAAPARFPFPTFQVTAPWMDGRFMEILTPREMPSAVRLFVPAHPSIGPDADPVDPATRIHPNQTHRITALHVVAPAADTLPPAAHYLAERGIVTFDVGGAWLLEATLDDGAQHIERDLRPTLPVVLRY
ncbi:MAG TPA: VOC family protein [Kofleriaceae bacterium]|nr:VOC family protein [Kofleriaceae bacterium]